MLNHSNKSRNSFLQLALSNAHLYQEALNTLEGIEVQGLEPVQITIKPQLFYVTMAALAFILAELEEVTSSIRESN